MSKWQVNVPTYSQKHEPPLKRFDKLFTEMDPFYNLRLKKVNGTLTEHKMVFTFSFPFNLLPFVILFLVEKMEAKIEHAYFCFFVIFSHRLLVFLGGG